LYIGLPRGIEGTTPFLLSFVLFALFFGERCPLKSSEGAGS
jgi:hypothetical protein